MSNVTHIDEWRDRLTQAEAQAYVDAFNKRIEACQAVVAQHRPFNDN